MSAQRKWWRSIVNVYVSELCSKFGIEHDMLLPRNVKLVMQLDKAMRADERDSCCVIIGGVSVKDGAVSHQICKAKRLWRLSHGWKR